MGDTSPHHGLGSPRLSVMILRIVTFPVAENLARLAKSKGPSKRACGLWLSLEAPHAMGHEQDGGKVED